MWGYIILKSINDFIKIKNKSCILWQNYNENKIYKWKVKYNNLW